MALLFLSCTAMGACAAPRVPPPGPREQRLGAHLEAALYRGAAASRSGDLRVARAPGGAVQVSRAGVVSGARDDATVAAEVRARLADDPAILPRILSVDVDRGVARLSGAVDGRAQAAHAVLIALGVRGVTMVEATLTWVPPADLARLRSQPSRSR